MSEAKALKADRRGDGVADVVCPQCTTMFSADPGRPAACPGCGYRGGAVPDYGQVQTFVPPTEFLPPDPEEGTREPEDEEEENVQKPKEVNRVALASLIIGFVSIPIMFAGPVAVALGIAGIVQVQKKSDEFTGTGLAVTGIIFGFLTSIVWFILFVSLFAGIGRATEGIFG